MQESILKIGQWTDTFKFAMLLNMKYGWGEV